MALAHYSIHGWIDGSYFDQYISSPKLEISGEIFSFRGIPHILLSNMMYGEMIDIKISFELMNYQKGAKRISPTVRIKHVEAISLSSIPARAPKADGSKTYIEVPSKLLDRWRGERTDDKSILIVRATSVHSVSNFRAITNAAAFQNFDAFNAAQGSKATCAVLEANT